MDRSHHRHTWIGSDRLLARFVARPVTRFLAVETAGGALLLAAAVVALIWANSPWASSYAAFWNTNLSLRIGSFELEGTLVEWVNDGLMTVFFFVVGLEIKRELVRGELQDRRVAALPVIAAFGGLLAPALIFFSLNAGTPAAQGWAIPVATDIAFVVGVAAVLGRRVPASVKVFLLTLAIVDDLIGIVVIAVFYAGGVQLGWLAASAAVIGVIVLMRQAGVWYLPPYFAAGVAVWFTMYESGIDPIIAGVALALIVPADPLWPEVDADAVVDSLENRDNLTAAEVRSTSFLIQESVPVGDRLTELLHPWSSYVIVPIFALANAGVPLDRTALATAWSSRVTIGVLLGLVAGKTIGVFGASSLAVRLKIGVLPSGANKLQLLAAAMAAGIGFTVALFVTELAYDDRALRDQATIGIIAGSVVAAIACSITFSFASRRTSAPGNETGLDQTST
ncbi:MAG: Na+/H+ antiporter NhaA [Actinobacteria bacterium]|nr:Na+/H+ antiporter NhaA [Actinomycetota bacterium]